GGGRDKVEWRIQRILDPEVSNRRVADVRHGEGIPDRIARAADEWRRREVELDLGGSEPDRGVRRGRRPQVPVRIRVVRTEQEFRERPVLDGGLRPQLEGE